MNRKICIMLKFSKNPTKHYFVLTKPEQTQLTAEAQFPRNNPLISGINDFLESPPVSQLPTAEQ